MTVLIARWTGSKHTASPESLSARDLAFDGLNWLQPEDRGSKKAALLQSRAAF